MQEGPASALRGLRDGLAAGIDSADDFTFQLASVLGELGLAPPPAGGGSGGIGISLVSEVPSSSSSSSSDAVTAALTRRLPAVQQALVASVPTFLPALDARGRTLLDSFFAPAPSAVGVDPHVAATVARTAYLSLGALLAPAPPTPVPPPARAFVLDTLALVARRYGIDALYASVYEGKGKRKSSGSSGKDTTATTRALVWDDTVKAVCATPAKVANAVGRWGDGSPVPATLVPRPYFDQLAAHTESLAYSVAQAGDDPAPLRVLLEKLASIGLLSPPPDTPGTPTSPTPALLPAFLPRALEHLHPPAFAPPYADTFFPSLLLPLSPAALGAFASALLAFLPSHLAPPALASPPGPEARVHCAAVVLGQFLGAPGVGGEAWNAVVVALLKRGGSGGDDVQSARRRMVVAWVGTGGADAAKALIEATLEAWSDAKQVRYGAYAHQYSLTHILILAISLLPQYDPYLVALSHRGRFLNAVHAFLSHPDSKIRRLGMLVAEILSQLTVEDDGSQTGPTPDEEMADLKAGLEVEDETGEPTLKPPKPPSGPKRLKFTGIWDGVGDGKDESRTLRACVGLQDGKAVLLDDTKLWMLGWEVDAAPPSEEPTPASASAPRPSEKPRGRKKERKPAPKVVMLDDDQLADPLQGYDSPPPSSRSPSPSPSLLEEVRNDPSLAIDASKKRKLKRPVYVRQLAELLRDKDKPESIEMALQWGEGLVRAKRSFGTEVSDNAVAVAAAAIGLANPYNLDDFEERRQGLVTALVASSPRNVAPWLAETYFTPTYSLLQKSVMLTAMAMGARELAGLPAPEPRARAIDFPTKTLPPALHARYADPATSTTSQLDDAVTGMRNLLLSKGARHGEETVPELARERRLKVGVNKRRKVGDASVVAVDSADASSTPLPPPVEPYTALAAEYFILPLVNRFWDYFQDASVRESRAVSLGARFRGAGTGMVLSPLALEKLLLTLALLVHAARHAPTFLAVIAPSALELAVTVGARHPTENGASSLGDEPSGERDAHVVSAALELSLAALDAAVDLDKGRTLALDAPQVLLATGEWASGVFDAENKGQVAAGGGGRKEGRVRAASAAVLVKVAEVGERWGGMGMR